MSSELFEPVAKPWLILIVDDEEGVHDVSRLVLKRLKFDGRPVELIFADSAADARKVIDENRDIAVALIDVVMEDDQAGLSLVRDIREKYRMSLTRIILRTGNPGLAPVREVIQHFNIDDYREKSELTSDRLFTSVYTSLRAYQALCALSQTQEGLERIIDEDVFSFVSQARPSQLIQKFVAKVRFIVGALGVEGVLRDVCVAARVDGRPVIVSGEGVYASQLGQHLPDAGASLPLSRVCGALGSELCELDDEGLLLSFVDAENSPFAIWIPFRSALEPHIFRLIRIYTNKFLLGIENARLHHQIVSSQRIALSKLCEAVEMRSKETGQHIYRIAKYSRLLADLYGLPPELVDLVEAASPLHDIGKVAIPDSILKKAGKLSEDEMSIMRDHSKYGWELLRDSSSSFLIMGAEIALSHHEKWDGSGYPNGLAGESIPIHGRIVSLVDVFDALMSKRVYKEAFPLDKTLDIIRQGSGTSFEPRLVELLLDHRQSFHAIFVANPDIQ